VLESDDEPVAGREVETASTVDSPADTEDDAREGRATYSNRILLPTTSLRRLESKPIGSIGNAIARLRLPRVTV
jgi:hypothetical protein